MTAPDTPLSIMLERVVRFMDAGASGTIELQVHHGEIRGGRVIEAFRFNDRTRPPSATLDDNDRITQDTD